MKFMTIAFAIVFSFTLFAADKTKTVSLNISGMTCQSCVGTVEKALKKVDGVKEVKVDLKSNKATVIYASTGTTATLIKAVSDAGFTANEGKATSTLQLKKQMKSNGEECGDDCCGDESNSHTKTKKSKKTEMKKS